MRTRTRAVVASALVIAIALTAVPGVTFSWFTDSDTITVNTTTSKVDVTYELLSRSDGQIIGENDPWTISNIPAKTEKSIDEPGCLGLCIRVTNQSSIPIEGSVTPEIHISKEYVGNGEFVYTPSSYEGFYDAKKALWDTAEEVGRDKYTDILKIGVANHNKPDTGSGKVIASNVVHTEEDGSENTSLYYDVSFTGMAISLGIGQSTLLYVMIQSTFSKELSLPIDFICEAIQADGMPPAKKEISLDSNTGAWIINPDALEHDSGMLILSGAKFKSLDFQVTLGTQFTRAVKDQADDIFVIPNIDNTSGIIKLSFIKGNEDSFEASGSICYSLNNGDDDHDFFFSVVRSVGSNGTFMNPACTIDGDGISWEVPYGFDEHHVGVTMEVTPTE